MEVDAGDISAIPGAPCRKLLRALAAIDVLVTDQPNPTLLRNWREALQVRKDAHVATSEDHGNLFGAALPIGIERAVDTGRLRPGGHLVLGGFAYAQPITLRSLLVS